MPTITLYGGAGTIGGNKILLEDPQASGDSRLFFAFGTPFATPALYTGYIPFLREDVPVYASATTAFIAKAMQDSSMADFEKEVCYISRRAMDEGYLKTQREGYRPGPVWFPA